MQITESRLVAGSVSHMLYARIDVLRFSTIYSAKGRWGLLDGLLLTSQGRAPSPSANDMPVCTVAATNGSFGSSKETNIAPVGLQQVEQAVKDAASDILGVDLDGKLVIPDPILPPMQWKLMCCPV